MNKLQEDQSQTHEYVGFWVRTGASLLDGILFAIVLGTLTYMIYGDRFLHSEDAILGTADFIINYIVPLIATIAFWVYKSATPGKMAVKAIVVDAETGRNLTVTQSLIRYLGYILAGLPLGLGFFWVGWDSKKQGWHDKLAGTVVIRPKDRGVEQVSFEG